jgi:hypothetical protein
MNDVMQRLRAANPVVSCEPPPPSVLEFEVSADRPPLRHERPRWRPVFGTIFAAATAVLALAIFVGSVVVLSHRRPTPVSAAAKPAGERLLLDVVGTLGRPATAADRAILPRFRRLAEDALPAAEYGRIDYSTVRIAGPGVGDGVQVIFALAPIPDSAWRRLPARDRRKMEQLDGDWRVALMTVGGRYPGGVLGAMGARQIERGEMWGSGIVTRRIWSMTIVVPDGVARIVARGSAGPPVALTVNNNVAIGLHLPGKLRWPRTMVWYGPAANVVARIGPNR